MLSIERRDKKTEIVLEIEKEKEKYDTKKIHTYIDSFGILKEVPIKYLPKSFI